MATLLSLPLEILHCVGRCLDVPDLASWSCSSRALHAALTPILYHSVKDDVSVMCWACDEGRIGTVKRLLGAGASPNAAWTQTEPRWWTLRSLHLLTPPPPVYDADHDHSPSGGFHATLAFPTDVASWLKSHTGIEHGLLEHFQQHFFYQSPEAYHSIETFTYICYWTPLHIAASWGNDQLVSLLLDHGADVDSISRFFCRCVMPHRRDMEPLWTPLHTSMCHGHLSTTKLLLSRGASINVMTRRRGSDQRRFTALHLACIHDSLDVARALVEGGYQTDLTARDHSDRSPFEYAFFLGNWTLIDFLMEHGGVDVDAQIGPLNALGHACSLGFYAEALRLLDLGATPQCVPHIRDGSPLYFHLVAAAGAPDFCDSRSRPQQSFRLQLVRRLVQLGLDVNHQTINGATAIREAASFHRPDIVEFLLQSGADVRPCLHQMPESMSVLEAAVDHPRFTSTSGEQPKTVQLLLGAMARTPAPKLADIEAMAHDHDDDHDVLIDEYPDVTIDDYHTCIAFQRICFGGVGDDNDKMEVLHMLLKYKKAMEMADCHSLLTCATIGKKNFDVADLLLETGFTPPTKPLLGHLIVELGMCDSAQGLRYMLKRFPDTADDISCDDFLWDLVCFNKAKCAELLINEGASIESRNEEGDSMVSVACMKSCHNTVEVLLNHGADPDEITKEGGPLITIAARDGNLDMVRVLVDHGASIHSSPPGKAALPNFEGSTPLGCAIESSSFKVVRTMLGKELIHSESRTLLATAPDDVKTRQDLMLTYARALCRRQKPPMLSYMFLNGLDATIRDEHGNTMIHMVCDLVYAKWPSDDPEITMEHLAIRLARAIGVCLQYGVPCDVANNDGVSGIDCVLRIMEYSGDCEFRRMLGSVVSEHIRYESTPKPSLTAQEPGIPDILVANFEASDLDLDADDADDS
ncbi:ankyrin repeat-containing domain protein [Astrocystis sublimbata]|nr:ankyrin repeat-containing domain protein [Astrocystis sublimbata]